MKKYIVILLVGLFPMVGQAQATNNAEWFVREYYKDTPILAEIARCESTFRQFDSGGRVLRGVVNKQDLGVMQINSHYHEEDAYKHSLDIHVFEDNLEYAKVLYEKYGTAPWIASEKCWKQV